MHPRFTSTYRQMEAQSFMRQPGVGVELEVLGWFEMIQGIQAIQEFNGGLFDNIPSLKLTYITPENGRLEYYFPFGKLYFQGIC